MIFKKNSMLCLRLALAVLLAVPLVGCSAPGSELLAGIPASWVTCNDEAAGITVDYPSNWLMDNSPADGAPQIQIQTQRGDACFTIKVLPCPDHNFTFDSLTDDELVKYASDNWDSYSKVVESEATAEYEPNMPLSTIDGKKFITYCFNYKSKWNRHEWFMVMYVGLYNDKTYLFTSAEDTSSNLEVRLALIEIATSIRFEAAKS